MAQIASMLNYVNVDDIMNQIQSLIDNGKTIISFNKLTDHQMVVVYEIDEKIENIRPWLDELEDDETSSIQKAASQLKEKLLEYIDEYAVEYNCNYWVDRGMVETDDASILSRFVEFANLLGLNFDTGEPVDLGDHYYIYFKDLDEEGENQL